MDLQLAESMQGNRSALQSQKGSINHRILINNPTPIFLRTNTINHGTVFPNYQLGEFELIEYMWLSSKNEFNPIVVTLQRQSDSHCLQM